MSHLSIESLSQMYNQNLRLKFGSAPAQLLSIGEQAEKSLEKRTSALKNQFENGNMVNVKSQLSNHLSKQAMQGTVSSISWAKWDEKTKALDAANNGVSNKSERIYESPLKKVNIIRYDERPGDSSYESDIDDDNAIIVGSKDRSSNIKISHKQNSGSSRNSGRMSNSSSNMEMEKFF